MFFFSFKFFFFLLTSLKFVLLFKNVQGKEKTENLINLPELEVAEADPINTFMMTWLKAEDKRTEREEKRRDEDRLQQERWMQMIAEARAPAAIGVAPVQPPAPRLTLQKFVEGVDDDMGAYLQMFEATATTGEWPPAQWCVYLRSALSGQGLVAVASLAASEQIDYEVVRTTLLRTYHISSETYRKRIFETYFNSSNTEAWFRSFKQDFKQWIETSNRDPLETVLHELALQKLPPWLQKQMRNLNPSTLEELSEAVARYQGNSRKEGDPARRTDLRSYKVPPQTTSTRSRTPEYKQRRESNSPPQKDIDKQVKCFRCGKLGHMRRDCRVEMEGVNCCMVKGKSESLPAWTKPVEVNGIPVIALLDTGCTKSMVHPRCIQQSDYLPWKIAYSTASACSTEFPVARLVLKVKGGKEVEMAVGVSKHIKTDVILGHDVPHFRRYLSEAMKAETWDTKSITVKSDVIPPTCLKKLYSRHCSELPN